MVHFSGLIFTRIFTRFKRHCKSRQNTQNRHLIKIAYLTELPVMFQSAPGDDAAMGGLSGRTGERCGRDTYQKGRVKQRRYILDWIYIGLDLHIKVFCANLIRLAQKVSLTGPVVESAGMECP